MLLVQGDVFLVKVDSLPTDVKRVKRIERGYVLAEGEVTGHAHAIVEDINLYQRDGVLYIEASEPVNLLHEEHLPIKVDAGIWKVGTVREYDPFAEHERVVVD
ncbi:MAG: hypothetical protein HQK96_04200 [Nitrospirae bacterium]|nr:hypothetical protein [Nitrospirota bacterium]